MNKRILKLVFAGFTGIFMAFACVAIIFYLNEGKIETRPVGKHEVDALIAQAKFSNQPYLESILETVRGAMTEDTLAELINYTSAYSKHAIKNHPHNKIQNLPKKINREI